MTSMEYFKSNNGSSYMVSVSVKVRCSFWKNVVTESRLLNILAVRNFVSLQCDVHLLVSDLHLEQILMRQRFFSPLSLAHRRDCVSKATVAERYVSLIGRKTLGMMLRFFMAIHFVRDETRTVKRYRFP